MIPAHVGVLGGGRMGAGIAHAFLMSGAQVVVVDVDVDGARERVQSALDASLDRGLTPRTTTFRTASDVSAFAGCELVVEAVPEELALKTDALRRVEAALAPGAALASNTSSISIGTLAAALDRPADFLGLHFFNPVPASQLVEIVVGDRTSEKLAHRARDWVEALGKTPVTVHDAPGFASSRLGAAIGLEAIRMLEQGVASADDIDLAMTLGYKHPVGPLRLTDLVGLDVRLGIAEYLHAELGDRFEPPALLRRMVAEGKLGRKTGEGFFTWDD